MDGRLRYFLLNKGPWSRLAVIRPEVQRALDRLRDVSVDIAPRFTTAASLVEEKSQPGLSDVPCHSIDSTIERH